MINNEITIIYKTNKNIKNRIFGSNFVKNNKNKCTIIYKGDAYELSEEFDIREKVKKRDVLEIKLRGILNITDMSYIFSNCNQLISLPDIT